MTPAAISSTAMGLRCTRSRIRCHGNGRERVESGFHLVFRDGGYRRREGGIKGSRCAVRECFSCAVGEREDHVASAQLTNGNWCQFVFNVNEVYGRVPSQETSVMSSSTGPTQPTRPPADPKHTPDLVVSDPVLGHQQASVFGRTSLDGPWWFIAGLPAN